MEKIYINVLSGRRVYGIEKRRSSDYLRPYFSIRKIFWKKNSKICIFLLYERKRKKIVIQKVSGGKSFSYYEKIYTYKK